MKPPPVTIRTPKADQYIKLIGSSDFPSNQDGKEFHASLFDEILIARGDKKIRWRFDRVTPADVESAPLFSREATAHGLFPDSKYKLSENGLFKRSHLELQFHVSSPLSPKGKGIWVRLWFEIKDGNLEFIVKGGEEYEEGTGTHVADGRDVEFGVPNWFSQPDYRWVVDKRQQPSRGNALLCASIPGQPGSANLVHIDAGLDADDSSDYSLAFVLPAGEGVYDVCTELAIASSFVPAAPVSGYALRLDFDERARVPLSANGLHLRCLQEADRKSWRLDWLNVPGGRGARTANTLTLESVTQELLETHALGLATTRARNRLSFVPTWIATDVPNESVTLVFRLQADANQKLTDTRLESIKLPKRQRIALHCGGALDLDGRPLVQLAWAEDDPAPGNFLSWKLDGGGLGQAPHKLGVGAVLLSMASFSKGHLSLGIADEGSPYRRAPLEALLELEFDSATYTALSMDPELGFETLSDVVERARPWTFDLLEAQPCHLTVEESADQGQSRKLRFELKLLRPGEHKTDVILVDPSPFTVVRIQTSEKQYGDEILAEYLDDADQAPEWQFFSNRGGMSATLPPQGIGEEMIKGYLHLDRVDPQSGAKVRMRVPAEGELFDFRLTPPALLQLDRTDVDMARSEAPWSLRRLLGRRLGAVGVKLESADFELLYGLAAHLETEGLRIAELDGFIGRVPYSDELLSFYKKRKDGDVQQEYAQDVARWLARLWARPSWWRVYRDIAQRGRLLIDQGIEYRLRPSRDTAHPFDIGNRHDGPALNREPLRGGVDWPFQSRNVYEELLRKPTSSAGSIEGLVFGSLGGEGTQTAAFNNGKTLIITNSRQGRLDSITLIRIGRIAMLWNKARHVIVYERTTRVAPRYNKKEPKNQQDTLEAQPPFPGIAALRKVREYVEITEPRRRYPDHDATTPICGPLTQSVFGSIEIPVRSDWGQDIREGFVIALRGPVPDGHELEFPDPRVFLDLARAAGKGEGAIAHRIKSTERLVFFSSTRDQDDGDTDSWPAWPDVDFPLLKRPKPPELPYMSSFRGRSRQPDAAATELGMGKFTFTLDPAEEAVNLMHARDVPGLEARVTNINLARGLPTEARKQLAEVETVADAFGNVQAQLLDGLAELRATLRDRVAAGENMPLVTQPELQEDVKKLVDRLQAAVGNKVLTPPDPHDRDRTWPNRTWQDQQKERSAQYVSGVKGDAVRLGQQMQAQATGLAGTDDSAGIELARNQASAIVDAIQQQAKQRVGEVGFVPQQALAAVRRLLDSLSDGFESKLVRLAGDLVIEIDRIEQAYRHDMDSAADLEAQWRTNFEVLPGQLRQMLDMVDQMANGALVDWFSRLPQNKAATVYERLRESVEGQLGPVVDWLERWNDSLPPFDAAPPDFIGMRDTVTGMVGKPLAEALLAQASKLFQAMWNELAGMTTLMDGAVKRIDDWAKSLMGQLQDAASVEDLRDALLDGATGVVQELGKAAEDVESSIAAMLPHLSFGDLQGSMDALSGFQKSANDAMEQIKSQLSGSLGDLERAVREQAAIAENYVQAGGRQLEDWARTSLGPTVEIAKQNLGAGLETLRMLAEGPVTDTIRTSRELVGYYYNQADQALGLTRASAYFNDLGQDVLNSLSASMPFDRIRDRLLPKLDGLAIRDLFPDFCGIKLTYFLPDLDVPLDGSYEYDWIRLQHGFDKDRLRAWAKVAINKQFDEPATLFDLGPVKLRLLEPHFIADSDINVAQDGTRWQRTAAALNADFELSLNDKPIVTLREGSLNFDERGELKFDFDSEKLELSPELQFVTDALKALMPQVEGATITPLLPSGVSAALSLPLPDIGTGAFTLTGVTLNTHMDLLIADGFEISTGLWLSKPDRPFGLAVLFLGGGGWFGIDATYKPPSRFVTRVSVGVSAGAFVAVNFGFAQGSAGILFTGGVDFYRDWQSGGGSTAISIGILIWGEFSVMGIASASIRLVMSIRYTDNGGMVGTGTFSVSIRICWCFTLRVSRTAQKVFSGGGNRNGSRARVIASGAKIATPYAAVPAALPAVTVAGKGVEALTEPPDYGLLPATDVAAAVNDFFDTLAVYRSEP